MGRGAEWLAAILVVGHAGSVAADTIVTPGNLGNQTWTPTGSPYVISGDVLVQPGATLTIDAGTVVTFAAGDTQAGGKNSDQSELQVSGTLAVNGTAAMPVTFRAQTGTRPETWYGIVVMANAAAATITGALIRDASIGVYSEMTASPLVVRQSAMHNDVIAVILSAGSANLSEILATDNAGGFQFQASGGTVTNSVVARQATLGTGGGGYGVLAGFTTAPVRIVNCTFDQMYTGVFSNQTTQPVEVVNSIITNGGNGLYSTGGPLTVSYSNIWNNTANQDGATAGAGVISTNPQYVSDTDLHLKATSVCIDSGTMTGAPARDLDLVPRPQNGDGLADPDGSAIDMGAYEFPAPGSGGTGGGAGRGGTGGAGGNNGGSGGGSGAGPLGGAGGAGGAVGGAGGRGGGGGGAGGTMGGAGASGRGGNGAGGSGTGGAAGMGGGGAAGGGPGGSTGAGGATGAGARPAPLESAAQTGGRGGAAGSTGGAGTAGLGRGGTGAESTGGGCGCRLAETPDPWLAPALILALAAAGRRRRRSPRRARCS